MDADKMTKIVRVGILMAVGGACLQFSGCFGGLTRLVNSINPCGTVLNCDPRVYQFVTSGIDSPGVRPDIDPFCTFAPFCTAQADPIFGGLATGGGP